jgi:hypothetical protein
VSLAEFLLARFTEDVVKAQRALDRQTPKPRSLFRLDTFSEQAALGARQPSAGAWGPERVLAECKIKREIVELAVDHLAWGGHAGYTCWAEDRYGDVLRLLALPYVGHPDFDDGWKVDWRKHVITANRHYVTGGML